MTDKTKPRAPIDGPESFPIRPGSVLYRALQCVAKEIVHNLLANRTIDETPTLGGATQMELNEAESG